MKHNKISIFPLGHIKNFAFYLHSNECCVKGAIYHELDRLYNKIGYEELDFDIYFESCLLTLIHVAFEF